MRLIFITILILVLVGVFFWWNYKGTEEPVPTVTNFEECAAQEYLVVQSYPRQCRTPDGRIFIEGIGNELEKIDLIRVTKPRPNELIKSPLKIEGEARGYWFFEADFPVKLLDENGNELGIGIAKALSEWMTEDFVAFELVLEFESPTTDRGMLILEKDNPSGLPENADELRIPVRFNKLEGVCKDLGGDGICQEVVCMAVGCPCAESPQTCSQDCK